MRSREPRTRAVDPSPFGLSLVTAFPASSRGRTTSDSSAGSPLSSATASPTSSPTSALRRVYRGPGAAAAAFSTTTSRSDSDHYYNSSRSRSQSPWNIRSALRDRSSMLFLRRRPSAVEMALCEERSRCDEDSIERQGLSLMEPRPVDPIIAPMDLDAHLLDRGPWGKHESVASSSLQTSVMSSHRHLPHPPRFVMGGILEVMEGRA